MSSRIGHLLNKTGVITRSADNAADGMGGWTRSASQVWEDVAMRIQPASARERESAGRQQVRHDYTIYLDPDTDILRGDSIVADGRTFGVELDIQPSSPGIYRKVMVSTGQDGPS